MVKYPAGICKKCGSITGYNNTLSHTCYICGQKLELLPNLDWSSISHLPVKDVDKYRLEFQNQEKYDRMAYLHREHMDITRKNTGINCPDDFDRTYREGVVLPECPYCHGYYTKKIGAGSRLFSVGLFGLGSSKVGKQWHCCLCNSDF